MFVDYFKGWYRFYKMRKLYCTGSRYPFYALAGKYLPENKKAFILDIGSGSGKFERQLGLKDRYENLFLLDGNENTVQNLKKEYSNVLLYKAGTQLPFKEKTIDYIHSSHLIEHLDRDDFYGFLQQINSVLMVGGVAVISSPLLWSRFYNDLSHVRPYNPSILYNYLCSKTDSPTRQPISGNYKVENIVYRYRIDDFDEGWGSNLIILDLLIYLTKKVLYRLGLRKYVKTGYTIVLRKQR